MAIRGKLRGTRGNRVGGSLCTSMRAWVIVVCRGMPVKLMGAILSGGFFVKEVKNGKVFFAYTFRGYDIYLEMVKMDESFFFVSLYTIIILRFSSN